MASGPSLTADDVNFCRGKAPVVAVNDTYRLAPWADVLYACDARWWDQHSGVPSLTCPKYGLERKAESWGVTALENTGDSGLELDPTGLRNGRNSGYQAINLAVHLGAVRILLLGYDMQAPVGGPVHFFGDHPRELKRSLAFDVFLRFFDTIVQPLKALGVQVINCSRRTALTCFPTSTIEQAMA